MSVRVVLLFLLVMVGMAIFKGPPFRRALRKIFGIGKRDR